MKIIDVLSEFITNRFIFGIKLIFKIQIIQRRILLYVSETKKIIITSKIKLHARCEKYQNDRTILRENEGDEKKPVDMLLII